MFRLLRYLPVKEDCTGLKTVSRKNFFITVKNDDIICLARSIVTAYANLKPDGWTKTQLRDSFNRSRKLQRDQAMKLHEEANVEINDYGNDFSDVESFARHLGIEINIIDAEQFNSIVYTANKDSKDKTYLLKTRNQFDVINSLTAFYDSPYYCHECKKAHTKMGQSQMPIKKCLFCFTYAKDKKSEGNEIICKKCNRKFFGKRCFKNHLKNRSKVKGKTDIVCDLVKKCNNCSRIITGKFTKEHKCGYSECNNCNNYVGRDHKCYLKRSKQRAVTVWLVIRNLSKLTRRSKRRIGVIPVDLTKTQEPTPLTYRLHKTSTVTNTYTTTSRNFEKDS